MKKEISIKNGKIEIAAQIFSPDFEKKLPAVILSHEYASSMKRTMPYANALSKEGFHVFIFDFPGSGTGASLGRSSLEMTVFTEKDDLGTVLDFAKAQPFVDSDHIFLGGNSQGGFVTALLASERKDEIEKIFLNYPALCIPFDCKRGSILGTEINSDNLPEEFVAFGVRLSKKYVEAGKSLEPWREMVPFDKPVLILHGTADKIVDISFSKTAAQKYKNATLVELDGADHGFVKPEHFKPAVKAILDFLKK